MECKYKKRPLGRKSLCDIKKSDILKFYNSLYQKGRKYSTIKVFNCIISPCFDLAVDDDIIRKNPCKRCLENFSNDSEERVSLSIEEQEEMLRFVRESTVYYVYYPMLVFMICTAVRCGEAIGLTWNDVDFKNREISINHQLIYKKKNEKYGFYAEPPKTKSGIRVIPMTREVYNALIQQLVLTINKTHLF